MGGALSWVTLVLAVLAGGHAFLHLRRLHARVPTGRAPGPYGRVPAAGLVGAALLVGGALLLVLPGRAPWSPAQGLAPGLLVGAAAGLAGALVAALVAGRGGPARLHSDSAAMALIAGGLALLPLTPVTPLYPPLGFALGALLAGVALAAALRARDAGDSGTGGSPAAEAERVTLLALAGAAAAFLAVFHRSPPGYPLGEHPGGREWLPLPALFLAGAAAGPTLAAVLLPAAPPVLRAAAALLPALAAAGAIAVGLAGTPAFFVVAALGAAAAGLLPLCEADDPGEQPAAGGLLAALLLLGAAAVAFRLLHGYGLALLALGAAAALPALRELPYGRALVRELPVGGLALLVLLALYRVYLERAEPQGAPEPEFFYSHAALVAGALLPALLARAAPGVGPAVPGLAVAWEALLAGVAVAVPAAAWVLVGARPQSALLVGLSVGAGLALALPAPPHVTRLPALTIALAAALLTPMLQPLALWTRGHRVGLLLGIGAALLAAMAGLRLVGRKPVGSG